MSHFGAALRAARKAKRWSLGYLATRLAMSHSHLSEIELGKRLPQRDVEAIRKLSAILEVDPQDMLEAAILDRGTFTVSVPEQSARGAAATALALSKLWNHAV